MVQSAIIYGVKREWIERERSPVVSTWILIRTVLFILWVEKKNVAELYCKKILRSKDSFFAMDDRKEKEGPSFDTCGDCGASSTTLLPSQPSQPPQWRRQRPSTHALAVDGRSPPFVRRTCSPAQAPLRSHHH